MDKFSIAINTTDSSDKKLQKTITNIDPNATADNLVEFSSQLNALTTNSFKSVTRVDRYELQADEPKPYATLTIAQGDEQTGNISTKIFSFAELKGDKDYAEVTCVIKSDVPGTAYVRSAFSWDSLYSFGYVTTAADRLTHTVRMVIRALYSSITTVTIDFTPDNATYLGDYITFTANA